VKEKEVHAWAYNADVGCIVSRINIYLWKYYDENYINDDDTKKRVKPRTKTKYNIISTA